MARPVRVVAGLVMGLGIVDIQVLCHSWGEEGCVLGHPGAGALHLFTEIPLTDSHPEGQGIRIRQQPHHPLRQAVFYPADGLGWNDARQEDTSRYPPVPG
jgi:hypothetical protein